MKKIDIKKTIGNLSVSYAKYLNETFENLLQDLNIEQIINILSNVKGKIVTTGIGKSGYIANKAAASMASTGSLAVYLHPAEAVHGDLGILKPDDVLIAISYSGSSVELFPVVNYAKAHNIKVIAIVASHESKLAKIADFVIKMPIVTEPTHLPAPFISTMTGLVIFDVISILLLNIKNFAISEYRAIHPSGKIGLLLKTVGEVMHTGNELPIVKANDIMKDAIITMSSKRLGALVVSDEHGKLLGVVTDGDIRRKMSSDILKKQVHEIMITSPKVANEDLLISDAVELMNEHKISFLIIVDCGNIIRGIVHIHDLLKLLGNED